VVWYFLVCCINHPSSHDQADRGERGKGGPLDVTDARPALMQLQDLLNDEDFFEHFHMGDVIARGGFGTIHQVR
jgi:hypothetical protein